MGDINTQQRETRQVLAASHSALYDFYMKHDAAGTKQVTVEGISLQHDHNLSEVKRKIQDAIGTPFAPQRAIGKGTTEFQFGGFVPTNNQTELTVVGYINAVVACNVITPTELSTLDAVCKLAMKPVAA